MRVKVIFDREKLNDELIGGWGISFLLGEDVLFDTGEKSEYILKNIEVLKIDMNKIKKIIISHNHWDHRQGLWGVKDKITNLEILACQDFIEEFKDRAGSNQFSRVEGLQKINESIYTTGCIKTLYEGSALYEQFLIIRTEKGISLVCGCSHPGILEVIKKVKENFPNDKIYSVFGGFHLMDKDQRFIKYVVSRMKELGIERVGPSHCSGFPAVSLFKELYKEKFIDIKAGVEFEV